MLNTKVRHLKHLLNFDCSEKKEEYKNDSDQTLDALNIDKNEFFLMDRQETALFIANNFHENDTYKSIQAFKTSKFIMIHLNCHFLKGGFDSDFGQLLLDGKKSFENLDIMSPDQKNETIKETINITEKEYLFEAKALLTRDSLLEELSEYKTDDRLTDEVIDKALTIKKFFRGNSFSYRKTVSIRRTPEIDALFYEEV